MQTDGHTKIWITEPYRPFALAWSNGRAAAGGAGPTSLMPPPAAAATPADAPRRLSTNQTAQIVQALSGGSKGHLFICNGLAAHDADEFADDIAAAFRKAGWRVDRGPLTKVLVPPPTGIAIELPGNGWQPEPNMSDPRLRELLGGATHAAGIKVDIRSRTELWNQVHAAMIIGRKPSSDQV